MDDSDKRRIKHTQIAAAAENLWVSEVTSSLEQEELEGSIFVEGPEPWPLWRRYPNRCKHRPPQRAQSPREEFPKKVAADAKSQAKLITDFFE